GVERLAEVPLLMAHLDIARGHVVDCRIAEDVLHRIAARDVAPAGADHHRALRFVVDLRRDRARQPYRLPWPDDALRHLGEHDGPGDRVGVVVLEYRTGQLFRMLVIVATHAEDVAPWPGNRRLEPHRSDVDRRA